MNDINLDISKTLIPFLDDISEKLSRGNVSIMVGAGFSKNAEKNDITDPDFPEWGDLAKLFFHKLYSRLPNSDDADVDPLILADHIITTYNRAEVENILKENIPNDKHRPSELHNNLLSLPWTDVFTTNYDTLLERAAINTNKKYSLVTSYKSLPNATKPRIVKLHGSFNSDTKLIIAEQDYLSYEDNYPLFVHTVRQNLVENTLCLIGFSGKDPNFKKWMTWAQNKLTRDYTPKIYLIGCFDFDHHALKSLDSKNITVINMVENAKGSEDDYLKSSTLFTQYLHLKLSKINKEKQQKKPNTVIAEKITKNDSTHLISPRPLETKWQTSNTKFSLPHDVSAPKAIEELKEITQVWKNIREAYPGWIICPQDKRESLWNYTRDWCFGKHFSIELPALVDLEFLFELNWRLEKCLTPIFDNLEKSYESILSRYNPFPEHFEMPSSIINRGDDQFKELAWDRVSYLWIQLHLSLLRLYREEGLDKKWDLSFDIINKVKESCSTEQQEQLRYEQCLYHLFHLNVPDLKNALNEWTPLDTSYSWKLKKSGLLAEVGKTEESEMIISNTIDAITSLSPTIELLSLEAYSLQLHKLLKDRNRTWGSNNDQSYIKSFNDRWNSLRQYKCDPWNELELFKSKLKHQTSVPERRKKIYGFDIGHTSISSNFGSSDKHAFEAYEFLRYTEDVGIPFHIPDMTFGSEPASEALRRISTYSRPWAEATLVRIGNTKFIDTIFDRVSLSRIQTSKIDQSITKYLQALNDSINDIALSDKNIGTHLSSFLPEALSRLSVKCSLQRKKEIFIFLKSLYNSPEKRKYDKVENLTKRLLEAWPHDKKAELIVDIITSFPIVFSSHPIMSREYSDPLNYIDPNFEIVVDKTTSIPEEYINNLITRLNTQVPEEKAAIFNRLYRIYNWNLLTEGQVESFGETLWKVTDSNGFPEGISNYYKFIYLKTPHPNRVDPSIKLKKHIEALSFPIVGDNRKKGISMTQGNISAAREIISTSHLFQKENGISWDESDAWNLFKKVQHWWETDKKYLQEDDDDSPFGSICNEFKARFNQLANILTTSILRFLPHTITRDKSKQVSALLKDMRDHDICVTRPSIIAAIHIIPDSFADFYNLIDFDIISEKNMDSTEAIKSIVDISEHVTSEAHPKYMEAKALISKVVECIKWRKMPGLVPALANMETLIERHYHLVDETMIHNIAMGLKYLRCETDLLNKSSLIPVEKRLYCREYAAMLANTLYHYYKSNKQEVPIALCEWKLTCQDLEEFSEIRNKWRL